MSRLHPHDSINELAGKKAQQVFEIFDLKNTSEELAEEQLKLISVILEKIKEAIDATISLGETFDPACMGKSFARDLIAKLEKLPDMKDGNMEKDLEGVFRTLIFTIFYQWKERAVNGVVPKTSDDFDMDEMRDVCDPNMNAEKLLSNLQKSGITDNKKLKKLYERLLVISKRTIKTGALKKKYIEDFNGDPIGFPKGKFNRADLHMVKKYLERVFKVSFEEVQW